VFLLPIGIREQHIHAFRVLCAQLEDVAHLYAALQRQLSAAFDTGVAVPDPGDIDEPVGFYVSRNAYSLYMIVRLIGSSDQACLVLERYVIQDISLCAVKADGADIAETEICIIMA